MGAVAAELQSIGHRPNFFYLQHAMGLASSMGLGHRAGAAGAPGRRLRRRRLGPDEPRRPDDAGALPAAESGARRVRQREPAVGRRVSRPRRRPAATSPASPRPPACRARRRCATLDAFTHAFDEALAADELTTIVAKVEAVGPAGYVTDLALLENRFEFQRYLRVTDNTDRISSTSSPPAALRDRRPDAAARARRRR